MQPYRTIAVYLWLTLAALFAEFGWVWIELNFYREFHQRLNALVVSYLAGRSPLNRCCAMLW